MHWGFFPLGTRDIHCHHLFLLAKMDFSVKSWEEEEVSGKLCMFMAATKWEKPPLTLVNVFVSLLVADSGVPGSVRIFGTYIYRNWYKYISFN